MDAAHSSAERTNVIYVHTADDIVKLLSRSVSPIILVFWLRAPIPNSKGNLVSRGQIHRWENFAICD